MRPCQLAPVNFGMTPDIKQRDILVTAAFCEDDPKIMLNDDSPFAAHSACKGMISEGRVNRIFQKQFDGVQGRDFIGRREFAKSGLESS